MEHKKYTHVCVLKYALYVYPAKSRARTRVYLTPARHLGPAGFSAVKLIGSLLFVGTLPEAHHAAHGRHAWSTFRERPGRGGATAGPAQPPRTRTAMSDRPGTLRRRDRAESLGHRVGPTALTGYFATTDTRPDLILFTELYTHSKITTAMERDWRSFFIHSRRGGAGSCRLQALNPRYRWLVALPPSRATEKGALRLLSDPYPDLL